MKKTFYPFWKKNNDVKRRPPKEVNIRGKNRSQIAITSWTPCDKTLVTDGSAGSIRERGCRSRQAA